MKPYIPIMMLLLVSALAAPFFIRDDEGEPLLSLEDLEAPEPGVPPVIQDFVGDVTVSPAADGAPLTVYKWQDENGIWHYSESADAAQPSAQMISVDPGVNVLHFEMRTKLTGSGTSTSADEVADMPGDLAAPLSTPLTSVPQLIQDAKNIERLQTQRLQAQEQGSAGE